MNLFVVPDYTDERRILELALKQGWRGNLYHAYLLYSLMMDENPLSLLAERRELTNKSLYQISLLQVKKLLEEIKNLPQTPERDSFQNFEAGPVSSPMGQWMNDRLEEFHKTKKEEDFFKIVLDWYEQQGCGVLSVSSVFRVTDGKKTLNLIPGEMPTVSFDDLIGYETQKEELCTNTESFLKGGFANNVLLYGDAGTGKSTSILALAERYGNEGLKIIQIHRSQTELLPVLFDFVRNRNYHFIISMDDLSFEEHETEYKELKSALEGDVTSLPQNMLIYATSNRRHLIKENWNDRNDMEHQGDVHRSETMEEKLSLSARFGLRIFYGAPTYKEYQAMVSQLAEHNPVAKAMPPDELAKLAGRWQISAGSTSGRTAQQFINSLQ